MIGKIHVINLERSTERRSDFIRNNIGLDYEFVPAVDGALLAEEDLRNEQHFIHPLRFPSKGAYGLALTNLSLWNKAIEDNAPLTIAEDDAIFRGDFSERASDMVRQLPADWDFILWGWNFDSILSLSAMPGVSPAVVLFSQQDLRKNIDRFRTARTSSHPFRLDKCFGTPAYTISPRGADNFRRLCFPMRNFEVFFPVLNRKIPNTGIDISMNRIYSQTNSFVSFPPLVATRNEHAISTIRKEQ